MSKKMVLLTAAILMTAVFPWITTARLLYHETVTIALEDGTKVNLVLDDAGIQKPAGNRTMRKIDFARMGFRARVAQRRKEIEKQEKEFKNQFYIAPWQTYYRRPLKQEKEQREKYLQGKIKHQEGRFLWPLSGTIREKRYYYLPPPPTVSTDSEGKPQFLFIKFVTDKAKEKGGVAGGIFHFLAEYGLTAEQEKELEEKLKEKIEGAKLMGAVPMESGSEESTFRIISATLTDKGFTKSLISSGKAPLLPGQKVAAAARLDEYGATLLEETLKRPTSDISIEFNLAYTSFLPAFEGTINVNWEKFKAHYDDYTLKYSHIRTGGCKKKDYYNTSEVHEIYDVLCEEGIVNIQWTEEIVDERVNMIREAFMKIFTNMTFDKKEEQMFDDGAEEQDAKSEIDKAKGTEYNVNKFKVKSQEVFRNTTYHLRTNLPVKTPYQTVGNINGAWYVKTKEEHPECFGEINLDEPFFQKRKLLFTLDLDAAEIFDKEINYVTVEVRKKRQSGRDFMESITFDKKRVTQEGVSAAIEYARMRDDDAGVYEFKTQWSLRGGKLFPQNPNWKKGEWEGVTLAPPIKPLNIDAECDPEELKTNDIAAVTVKLRYYKYGRHYEDPKTLRISASSDKPLASHMIFHDTRNAKYDYKITYHHKSRGPVSMGWVTERDDGYIYCYVPEKLIKKEKSELY